MKICIVAWDVIGASKTTGVGTFNFEISKFLNNEGHDVTILYVQSIFYYKDITTIQKIYSDLGIKIIDLGLWAKKYYHLYNKIHEWYNYYNSSSNYHLFISDKVRDFLESHHFDIAIFSECNGNGYRAVQAKRTGVSLQDTKLVGVMHGSLQWCKQGMDFFNPYIYNFDGLILNYCEEYSVKYCDAVISLSKYMFQWAEENGWELPVNKKNIPYIYEDRFQKFKCESQKYKITEITFFGRLEVRKGVDLFTDAIVKLKKDGVLKGIERINFFGPEQDIRGMPSSIYIKEAFYDLKIDYRIKDIPYEEIQTYLLDKGDKNLVVVPSILDNFPFTVIELIYMNIPFIASDAGGIPEMVGKNHEHLLFEPSMIGIYNKIKEIIHYNGDFFDLKNLDFDNEHAKKLMRDFLIEIGDKKETKEEEVEINEPVTVIISGDYNPILKEAIKSIKLQSIDNLEIIVLIKLMNDVDNSKIQDLTSIFPDCTIMPTHGNLNVVKNDIISKIKTKYIIFMDSATIADSNLVEILRNCIRTSNLTALTAYNTYYHKEDLPDVSIKSGRAAIGGSYLLSLFENIFEDQVFIIKKEALMEISGFDTNLNDNVVVWDIFSKLMLKGYQCDTIPQVLYNTLYREMKRDLSTGVQIIFKNYPKDALKDFHWELIKDYLAALHRISTINMSGAIGNTAPQHVCTEFDKYSKRTQALLTLFSGIPFAKEIILKLARLHHQIFRG